MRFLSPRLIAAGSTVDGIRAHLLEAVRLCYQIYYPNDEDRNAEVLTTLAAEVFHRFDANISDLRDRALRVIDPENAADIQVACGAEMREALDRIARESLKEVHDHLFMPAGGFGAVARADGYVNIQKEITALRPRMLLTGSIVRMAYGVALEGDVRGGTGFKKAEHVVRECPRGYLKYFLPRGALGQATMRGWRTRFMDVAHLSAAWCYFIEQGILDPIMVSPTDFLRVAQVYQDFGLYFAPHGRDDSLLPAETLWRVPENTPEMTGPLVLDCLLVEEKAALGRYRATY